jgi:hypothetical protein
MWALGPALHKQIFIFTIGTKAKHFDLVQKIYIASRSFPFLPKNSGTKQSNLIWSVNCLRQCRMILFKLKTNIEAKGFDLVRLLSERKQNILIWSKLIFYASRSFSVLAQKFWDEAKQFDLVWKLS